jgi:hypothetical protein
MKSLKFFTCFSLMFLLGITLRAQDNTDEKLNLPGDNLNLYAVMTLFQESETLEGFEKNLNIEDSKINNLDLNNDDKTDYIKVIDEVDGDAHTIILQVAVTERENQDVAVFTVQKDANNQVQIQLVGDEELYGRDYIIEPNYSDAPAGETPNPGYTGTTTTVQKEQVVVTKTTYVEVASWPVVTYIYTPAYVVYRSPWYWGYYPPYWNPWRPYYYDYYYGYHSHYHSHYYGHYRHSYHHRYPHYNDHYYSGHRSRSNTVYQHRQSGAYKNTYSRPETRQQGSADFNKKYPNGYRPESRPATNNNGNRPATKPATTNGNRPATRPATNNGNRPATRPATNNGSRPATKPATNNENRPATRPATNNGGRPATKPATNNPSTRPGVSTPSTKQNVNKPATRPQTNRPTQNTNVSKPSSRPASGNPSAKPNNTRPASKPATTRTTPDPKKNNANENNRNR